MSEPLLPSTHSLPAEVVGLQREIAATLARSVFEAEWLEVLQGVAGRMRALAQVDLDRVLYLLVQDAQRGSEAYSSRHALFCALVAWLCSGEMGWPQNERDSLVSAALTMNLSMTEMQNDLAFRDRTLTVEQRRVVQTHAARSAEALHEAGIDDALWIEVVARHHEEPDPLLAMAELPPPQRVAALLRRVDVFTAKISARKVRAGMPATLAAQEACLGPNGQPDALGAALLKTLGLYPPGSYVKLANGELAVVKRRGAKANEPLVLSLTGRDGRALPVPVARHTARVEHAVKAVALPIESRALAEHLRSAPLPSLKTSGSA